MKPVLNSAVALALGAALLLAACGGGTTQTAKTPPRATILGSGPVKYQIPSGWILSYESNQVLILENWNGGSVTETIRFQLDPTPQTPDPALPAVTVGGDPGAVVANWTKGEGGDSRGTLYEAIITHYGSEYELSCIGHSGFSDADLRHACETFASSVRFK